MLKLIDTIINAVWSKDQKSLRTSKAYELSDKSGTDPLYIGYVSGDGGWLIKKYSDVDGTMRFSAGDKDYWTNWENRLDLTYTLFSEVNNVPKA